MSETSPKRRTHRAAGPVDAAPRVTRKRDLKDSPRRRARLAQMEKQISSEAAATTPSPHSPAAASAQNKSSISPEAADLFTRWLRENGFQDFAEFQRMTHQAESERQQRLQPEPHPSRREKRQALLARESKRESPPTDPSPTPMSSPPTAEQTPAVLPPEQVSVRRELPHPQTAVPLSQNREPIPQPNQNPAPNQSPSPGSTAPPNALRAAPTIRLEARPQRSQSAGKPKPGQSRRRRKDQRQVLQPRPLSKTRKVPILLTLGVLLFLLVASGIPFIWYQTRVMTSQPGKSAIKVLGAVGAPPVLTLNQPLPLEKSTTELLQRGKGNPVAEGKTVALRITVFSGTDGKLLSAGGDESVLVGKLSPEVLGAQVYNIVRHATEGSRFILKHPVKSKGSSHMEIGVIDVLETSLTGQMVPPPPESGISVAENDGLPAPQVAQDFSGDFRVDTLIAGQGAPVSAGQSVLVKYLEYSYSDPPALLKEHWSEPVKLKLDDSVQLGVVRGIIDQKIGSRLLVQVPPAQGSGNQATILVVDVLAAWDQSSRKTADSL